MSHLALVCRIKPSIAASRVGSMRIDLALRISSFNVGAVSSPPAKNIDPGATRRLRVGPSSTRSTQLKRKTAGQQASAGSKRSDGRMPASMVSSVYARRGEVAPSRLGIVPVSSALTVSLFHCCRSVVDSNRRRQDRKRSRRSRSGAIDLVTICFGSADPPCVQAWEL